MARVSTVQRFRDLGTAQLNKIASEIRTGATVSRVRTLVVDDFEPYRQFVCSTLEQSPGFQVVGQAFDGQEAIQKAKETYPDLVILDVGLPTLNGIEAARQICRVALEAKIVFLSQETSPEVVDEALRLGALAYVAKATAANDLFEAIEAVLDGKRYVSSGLKVNPNPEEHEAEDWKLV